MLDSEAEPLLSANLEQGGRLPRAGWREIDQILSEPFSFAPNKSVKGSPKEHILSNISLEKGWTENLHLP